MNARRNAGRRVGEAAAGGNQAPPQAPTARVQVHVNPVVLTDGKLRATLVKMAKCSGHHCSGIGY